MSLGSRIWLGAVLAVCLVAAANALFLMMSPTLDPGRFDYSAAKVVGQADVRSYKGLPVLVVTDAEGRKHRSRCNPYALEQDCVSLAINRGLQPGDKVVMERIAAKGWPWAEPVIVRLATNDRVLLGCRERLETLGVDRSRIAGIETVVGC